MIDEKYYCTKCEKYHYRGNIYKKHDKYKKIEYKKQKLYKIKKSAWNKLSDIAKRQIVRLVDKLNKTKRFGLYREAISKVLEYELDKKDLIPFKNG